MWSWTLFVGSFLITVSFLVLVIGLFIFSVSSWFSLGRLYFSQNLSISFRLSILFAYSCYVSAMPVTFQFFFTLFIYLFFTSWGFRCCVQAFSSCGGFSRCRAQALGMQASVAAARGSVDAAHRRSGCAAQAYLPQGLWDLPRPDVDWSPVPCIGGWILNHWTTREVPLLYLFLFCF